MVRIPDSPLFLTFLLGEFEGLWLGRDAQLQKPIFEATKTVQPGKLTTGT